MTCRANHIISNSLLISPLPLEYPLPPPVPSLAVYLGAVWLSQTIYPGIYQTGYGRFRPNKSGHHSSCGYYRGGLCLATASQIFDRRHRWHPSYPALIP